MFTCNARETFHGKTDFVKRGLVTDLQTDNAFISFIPKHVFGQGVGLDIQSTDI